MKLTKARPLRAALTVTLAVVAIAAIPSVADAGHGGFAATDNMPNDLTAAEVRIVARRLDDGRTEFALQRNEASVLGSFGRGGTPTWGDPQLASRRFFPADARVGRWLASSPLDVSVLEESDGWRHIAGFTEVTVRIVARRVASGRLEFALQQRRTDDRWGKSVFSERRFFPSDTHSRQWLEASPTALFASHQPEPASPGRFTAVSGNRTAGRHACGVAADGTAICWGDNHYGQSNTPDGHFIAISAGSYYTCGIHTDQTLTCWGQTRLGLADTPDGEFTAVSSGTSHACALRSDGAIACWGGHNRSGQTNAPEGEFTAVTASDFHTCGLRGEGTITCWGYGSQGQADPPDGQFSAVTSGSNHTCGLGADGTITCWGRNAVGQANAPDGEFISVTAGRSHSCGLRTDRTITCWGGSWDTDAPVGEFSAVSAACGLRTDGTIVCW